MVIADAATEKKLGGHTWMWRQCCLDKVVEEFKMKEYKGSGLDVTGYRWCLTRDIGNVTIAGRKQSILRKGGLAFSQFYAMNKLQFDANSHFPWDDGDDTMALMALDKHYHQALAATIGSKPVDMRECRSSFNSSGRRYLMGIRESENKSFGAREEHRMTLTLLKAVNVELRCLSI